MTTLKRAICTFIAIMVLAPSTLALLSHDADAIPAFARKHKISCSTCHLAVPKLKPYGEEYAGNGFALPDGEDPKRAYIDTGDESLLLQRDLPFAVRFDAYVRAQDSGDVDSDIQTPYGVKLLSGGRVSKHVSYYFYFYMDERGEVAGLEDAYLHFNNIGGGEFDVMVGQFQVSDPLFKREVRLTFQDYLAYTITVGSSRANLTYDRGFMLTYGFDFGLDLIGQVINGNGIPDAGNRVFDSDSEKATSLRLSQSIGMVRVGGFGYFNKESRLRSFGRAYNEVWYAGGDFTVGGDKWECNAQYLRREDSNSWFLEEDLAGYTKLDAGFVEFTVMPWGDRSRWIFTGLYNRTDGDGTLYDYETATLSISHMAARNLRLLLEGTMDIDEEEPALTVGAMCAF